jgi:GSCFA family
MSDHNAHPYRELPGYCFWQNAMGSVPPFAIDPVVHVPFTISRSTLVAAGGSCFAQHIGRALQENGCAYHVVEFAPDCLPAAKHHEWNYGVFSARYGNIYTARQLLQLFDRAYGAYTPQLTFWEGSSGAYVDPFRPRIQPLGYASVEDLIADRERHLAAVRQLFETLDVFVFTLGLTESWEHIPDGAVLPLAPGVAGGKWQSGLYRFRNHSVQEVEHDLIGFVDRLRSVNPDARVILTVSPVPLVATYAEQHVLVSTCFSKSVLRVAASSCAMGRDNVVYFPSYEIITGPHAGGNYYEDDLRSVNEKGVNHVMRTFFRHFLVDGEHDAICGGGDTVRYAASELEFLKDIICDEDTLAR